MNDKHQKTAKMLISYLRQIAKEKQITHEHIAKKIETATSNVSRILTSKNPELITFLKVADAIGVRMELHSESEATLANIRNNQTPRFIMAPYPEAMELYILHTHYPACLIKVVQTIPATFVVVENYEPISDPAEIIAAAADYYRYYAAKYINNQN